MNLTSIRTLALGTLMLLSSTVGCATITSEAGSNNKGSRWTGWLSNPTQANSQTPKQTEAKPPISALPEKQERTVRFDGRQIVIGETAIASLSTEQFLTQIDKLLQQSRPRSAASFARTYPEVAVRALQENWACATSEPSSSLKLQSIRFLAELMDQAPVDAAPFGWQSLLMIADRQPPLARNYFDLRNAFLETLQKQDVDDATLNQLRTLGSQLEHPLLMIDSLQLHALRELLADRYETSEGHYLEAARIADQLNAYCLASELWLMVSDVERRNGKLEAAEQAWYFALERERQRMAPVGSKMNTTFWIRIDQANPADLAWPQDLQPILVASNHVVDTSILSGSKDLSALAVWTAIAASQMERGQPELALVNFKKAERFASATSQLWIRVYEAQCLAAIGQTSSATALLAVPMSSPDAALSATAIAAMGSIRIQTHAYQIGANLIRRALEKAERQTDSTKIHPSLTKAKTDLALSLLIMNRDEEGLHMLREVQSTFLQQADWPAFVQACENEASLYRSENQTDRLNEVVKRLRDEESKWR